MVDALSLIPPTICESVNPSFFTTKSTKYTKKGMGSFGLFVSFVMKYLTLSSMKSARLMDTSGMPSSLYPGARNRPGHAGG